MCLKAHACFKEYFEADVGIITLGSHSQGAHKHFFRCCVAVKKQKANFMCYQSTASEYLHDLTYRQHANTKHIYVNGR